MRGSPLLKNQMRLTNTNRLKLITFKNKMLEIHTIALFCCQNRVNLQEIKPVPIFTGFTFCTFQMIVPL